jgi:TetR/AcrR family tetracycline transcriptional repressor
MSVVKQHSRRPSRSRRAPLSRKRILEAALRLVDRHGLEALTMRSLGTALGVEAMALYYHVPDKNALLDGLVELLVAGLAIPEPGTAEWTDVLRAIYRGFRARLKAHPNLLPVLTSKPLLTMEVLRMAEVQYATLRRAGFSPRSTLDAYRTLGPYVLGYVLTETQFILGRRRASEYVPLFSQLTPGEFPATLELMPYQARLDWDQQFDIGLDLIFTGLAARRR